MLKTYRVSEVTGDHYAGETFASAFASRGITYQDAEQSASKNYEALEPCLSGHRVVLPHVPTLEQQLLGLVWRGGKIDHPGGEHDDWACAVAGLVHRLLTEEEEDALDGCLTWGNDDDNDRYWFIK